jgi:hypothetical protein
MKRGLYLVGVGILAAIVAAPAGSTQPRHDGKKSPKFTFGVVADVPYTEEQEAQFDTVIAEMNDAHLAFSVHGGDIKGGNTPCTDHLYFENRDRFNTFEDPLIYTPGDNEWTDCHRAGGDPLERLAFLREVFFSDNLSMGERKIRLEQQSDFYPENARWTQGRITFATLHVVGSNNNLGRTPSADAEYVARNAANLEWLADTFDEATASRSRGVVIVMQADPLFESPPEDRTGFNDTLAALQEETLAFNGEVLLIHGDTHYFRVDKPLVVSGQRVMNFTRLEAFGNPDVHWVEVTVDPRDDELFIIDQQIVPGNIPVP